jgi:superfamily II DNA/RNA helicase
VLLECIEEAAAKVLIIAPFKGIVRALEEELSQDYTVGVLNGDVSPGARDRIIREFKGGRTRTSCCATRRSWRTGST